MKLSDEHTRYPQLDNAIYLFDEGRFEEALARLRGLDHRRLDPEAQGTRIGLELACLTALRREDDARVLYWHAFERYRKEPELLLFAGIECSECGELEMAEQILRRLADLTPEDHLVAYNLGVVLDRAERSEEALAWFGRAIALNRDYAPAYSGRGGLLRSTERYEEALQDYLRYLELEPDDAYEWLSMGTVLCELGRYEDAYAAYDKSRTLNPRSGLAWYSMAVTAVRIGDMDRLRQAVEALHRLEGGSWRALMAAAFLAELEQDFGKAWDLMQDAIDALLFSEQEDDIEANLPYVIDVVLRFGELHGLDAQASALVDRCLELGLFYPTVLEGLRKRRGRLLPQARHFYVLIDGMLEDPEMVEELREADGDPDGEYGYSCAFRVFAHDAEDAEAEVLRFECEHGPGSDLRIVDIEELGDPGEHYQGVAFRSEMHTYAIDEEEDEEE